MRRALIVIVIGLTLCSGLRDIAAAEKIASTGPAAVTAPVVPVVNRPMELRVLNAPAGAEASLSVTLEGKRVFEGKATTADGALVAKWTPRQTGFHTVTFDITKAPVARLSCEFPVVWTTLYFPVWGSPSLEELKSVKYLWSDIISVETPADKTSLAFFKARGSRVLRYTSGSQYVPAGPLSDKTIDDLAAAWSSPMKVGYDGIIMDEFGEYPAPQLMQKLEGIGKALMKVRKQNPDMIIMPWNGGALLREEAIIYKYADAVALLETYPTCLTKNFASHSNPKYIDMRVETARGADLIYQTGRKHGAVISLGTRVDGVHEEPLTAEVEQMVRYIKKTAPEMPGISFYGGRYDGMLETEERLIREYYIKPVLDLRELRFSDYAPRANQPVDILVGVHNLGGMVAKDVAVKVYAKQAGQPGRVLLGEARIDQLGCGLLDLQKKSGKQVQFEYQEVNGNKYAVSGEYNTVFLARATRRIMWTPAAKGYHTITVEVEPSATEQYTILDGSLDQKILVR